jgi:competence protein ComEC
MYQSIAPAWKEAPFLRLLPPFITGILLQWYTTPAVSWLLTTSATAALLLLFIHTAPIAARFRLRTLSGICINALLLSAGALITYLNHPANKPGWLPLHYNQQGSIKAVLQEPLVRKTNSYKATAAAKQLFHNGNLTPVNGNIIVYFNPRVKVTDLSYGSIITISSSPP